jgi:hypothetical protein
MHVLGLSFGNLLHLSRRGLTSFERRFLEESEESLPILSKAALSTFEFLLQLSNAVRMIVSPHLHASMPHVEKFADLLVMLLLPIFPLTSKQYKADWQAAQYWSRTSGDATTLEMMQLLGMIAAVE